MSLEQRLADLEKRQQRIADIQEITNLFARYSNAADGGWDRPTHNGKECAALFTEDGVWDGGKYGKAEGRAAIEGFFDGLRAAAPFAFHTNQNPMIELNVDGDTATGQWHHILFIRTKQDAVSAGKGVSDVIGTAIYNNKFERTKDGWRIKYLHATAAIMSPFTEGWGAQENLAK